jgi:molecular chaperone DnaK
LQQTIYTIGSSVYQQAAPDAPANEPTGGGSSAGGDDVIDAEFSETK